MSKNIIGFIVFFLLGSGLLYSFMERKETDVRQQQSSEHIQLALRRAAHLLLKHAGDSTTAIEPVKQMTDNKYLVELAHDFNYDSLPAFLQNSFEQYGITEKYDVAVWDCSYATLLLGYASVDFQEKGSVACQGRRKNAACSNFTVTLTPPSVKTANFTYLMFILGGLMALALAIIPYFNGKGAKNIIISPLNKDAHSLKDLTNLHTLYIGKTQFDTKNHTLSIDNLEFKLTFQEAQLLQLFCQHRNEVLERDFILKTVWDDDGALITRSVDVFVSRLRKLLKPDASLKITTVHGRGYRFEI